MRSPSNGEKVGGYLSAGLVLAMGSKLAAGEVIVDQRHAAIDDVNVPERQGESVQEQDE